MKANTFYLVSLGCAKNTVDSTSMAQLMESGGYRAVEKPGQANILIVNTCGFIQPAREESLQELRTLAKRKKPGQILIAAGCLAERHREQLAREVPGLDGILSTRRWMDVLNMVQHLAARGTPSSLMIYPKRPMWGGKITVCYARRCKAAVHTSKLRMAAAAPARFAPSH